MSAAWLVTANLTIASLSACENQAKPDVISQSTLENSRDALSIDLPKSYTIDQEKVADFDVYLISKNSVPHVGIYAGNAADQSNQPSRMIKTRSQWPSQLQVWIIPGDETDPEAALKIAASVRAN